MKSQSNSESTNPEADVVRTLEIDQLQGGGRRLKLWIIIAMLLIVPLLVYIVIRQATGNANVVQYKTIEVQRGSLTVIVNATGTLQPTNKVDVSSELSGIMKSVYVDYNDMVKVGQVLAKLDTSKIEAQVTQTKASLDSAKARVLQAQATVTETRAKLSQLKRVWELSNNRMPSKAELDAAEAALERALADESGAKAAVTQAQAILDAYETDMSKAVIRSPINGIVLTRSIEPGQTVASSFQAPVLFTLAEDLTQMELHVNVDEADVGKVQKGQRAIFSVSAYPNRNFEALISQVRYGSSTTSGVVTYETVLKVNNSDLSLRPGMTATADITVKQVENAILVPGSALRFTPPVKEEKKPSAGLVGSLLPRPPSPSTRQHEDANKKQQRVWTLKNDQLIAIPVTIGATDGSMTEVVTGDINTGMMLVVDTVNTEN